MVSIGSIELDVPVVLAPMAGVTNTAFRRLCREYGAGLYVCEMITARALLERNEETMRLISHHPSETPRSVQLYSVDAKTVGAAARMIAEENLADHIDLNFGCPVPKVTRRGGGSALPWKRELFEAIVSATVRGAGELPVTVKMRKGIDEDHLTFLEAGVIAQDVGAKAVTLHGRTTEDNYSGRADWGAIAKLKETVRGIPVFGNGDIWQAEDALAMMEQTGVDGVVVGRGCLGRPWLFGDLANAMRGNDERYRPGLAEVAIAFRRHAELLIEFFGEEDRGCRDLRKHVSWYFKGYGIGGDARRRLSSISSLDELDEVLETLDQSLGYDAAGVEGQRGRAGSARRPVLPEFWLDSRELSSEQRTHLIEDASDTTGG